MKAGGGKEKGSGFERECCVLFSLWISRGQHRDLFERNVTSGGAFTSAAKRGVQRGVPGDLMASHPLSFPFLERFMIEAKFWNDLFLDRAMWNPREEICKVIREQEDRAAESKRIFLLVAKQNRRYPLIIMPAEAGIMIFSQAVRGLEHHLLWNSRIFICRLDHALAADPDEVIKLAAAFTAGSVYESHENGTDERALRVHGQPEVRDREIQDPPQGGGERRILPRALGQVPQSER